MKKCPNCGYRLEKISDEWICLNMDCDFYELNALVEWDKYQLQKNKGQEQGKNEL